VLKKLVLLIFIGFSSLFAGTYADYFGKSVYVAGDDWNIYKVSFDKTSPVVSSPYDYGMPLSIFVSSYSVSIYDSSIGLTKDYPTSQFSVQVSSDNGASFIPLDFAPFFDGSQYFATISGVIGSNGSSNTDFVFSSLQDLQNAIKVFNTNDWTTPSTVVSLSTYNSDFSSFLPSSVSYLNNFLGGSISGSGSSSGGSAGSSGHLLPFSLDLLDFIAIAGVILLALGLIWVVRRSLRVVNK
jgi:hypothetical protein